MQNIINKNITTKTTTNITNYKYYALLRQIIK